MARASAPVPEFSFRHKVAVAAAALLSVWGTLQYFQFETEFQKQPPDPYQIHAQAARFEGVIAATPENAELGYLTDAPAGSVADGALFAGAQYALAPRLLQRYTAQDRALGSFGRPADFAEVGRAKGLRVERDFGSGVVLFRKENAK
jgi:hypothetical protein